MKRRWKKTLAVDAQIPKMHIIAVSSTRTRYLQVLIETEGTSVLWLCLLLTRRVSLLLCAGHYATFLVVSHALLEEVGLARKRYVLHKVEWVGSMVEL